MNLQKIRVLHITVGLDWGGAEKLMAEVAVRADPGRFSIEVLALKSWGPIGDVLRRHGVRVTALGGSPFFGGVLLARLRRFLRENRFDIVHSHLFWANVLAAAAKTGERLVWHLHETGFGMSFWRRGVERALFPRADRAIAISQAVARSMAERVPSAAGRLAVIPNAVLISPEAPPEPSAKSELQRRSFGFSSEGLLVGFVGRLDDPVKGVSVLLEAAKIVRREMPLVRFVIVGDGKDRSRLEKKAQAEDLGAAVVFMGAMPATIELFSALDVLALPSLSEGMGMVLLEAMEASVPVVATTVGGIPEAVVDGETGILVPPGNAEKLASALISVLSDPAAARRMGENGRRRVEQRFSIDRYVSEIDRIYTECLEGAG